LSISSSSLSYFIFQNTVITKNIHNQAARKSPDQQSWLPILTTQIRYELYNKQKQKNLKLNVCRVVQEVQLVQCQLTKSVIIIM